MGGAAGVDLMKINRWFDSMRLLCSSILPPPYNNGEYMKAMFIPLKTEYYEAFKDGSKREELRLYNGRWNELTCRIGRKVILSKGYGSKNRMEGVIKEFRKQRGDVFGAGYQASIMAVYGTLDIDIACFYIGDIRVLKEE